MRLLVAFLTLFFMVPSKIPAESRRSCPQVIAMAQMLRAVSAESLLDAARNAGKSYPSRLVFAFRSFELHPKSTLAAGRLLDLIPTNGAEQTAVVTMGDYLCPDEKMRDVTALAHVRDGFPRLLADATLIDTEHLDQYLIYARLALDPHSDYALQLSRVCRARHARFLRAVKSLSPKDQAWLRKYVINPNTCRALFLPEAGSG